MSYTMIDITDDERMWDRADTMDAMRAQRVEDVADNLMDECKRNASEINMDNDLYDGDLLPDLMTEIAKWTGSSADAVERMKALFNRLADEFGKIAEREVE